MCEENEQYQNEYSKYVAEIQNTAKNINLPNCVSKKLKYQQALSILLRSRQLIREGIIRPTKISPEIKAKQIDECYKQMERK